MQSQRVFYLFIEKKNDTVFLCCISMLFLRQLYILCGRQHKNFIRKMPQLTTVLARKESIFGQVSSLRLFPQPWQCKHK